MFIAWGLILVFLAIAFGLWDEKQFNPNQSPASDSNSNSNEVTLIRNRFDHYVTSGKINHRKVTFLLDTGATDVVIPEHLAEKLKLERGVPKNAITANGIITVYNTTIGKLEVGSITLQQVEASINPGMSGDEILLGMSALRNIEFIQRGDTLKLKQYK